MALIECTECGKMISDKHSSVRNVDVPLNLMKGILLKKRRDSRVRVSSSS